MADPLSIAASIVGITTAGVQASIKLYALAETVSTASPRVTAIANDISTTCAILNQVRELIIPQPNAQGILKSVFNSVALNDIWHALQRCQSIFREIDIRLRQAFEQVGKRNTLHSKIQLSRFEKAKWPFLQPQFDDLRIDLRDSKGNLILMIAVASLALARRDGHQRSVHEGEQLELESTIVQLQRALTVKPPSRKSSVDSHSPGGNVRELHGKQSNSVTNEHMVSNYTRGTSSEQLSEPRGLDPTEASPLPRQIVDSVASSGGGTRKNRLFRTDMSMKAPSGATHDSSALGSHAVGDDTSAHEHLKGIADAQEPESQRPSASPRPRNVNGFQVEPAVEYDTPANILPSNPSIVSKSLGKSPVRTFHPTTPTGSGPSHKRCHYRGWSTDYSQGLVTGYGNSVFLRRMDLSDRSLEKLAKTHTDEGHDPNIAMFELTAEQQRLIKQTYLAQPGAKVLYVRLNRNITVPSVFGTLTIETLKWIVWSNVPWPAGSPPVGVSLRGKTSPSRSHTSISDSDQTVSELTDERRVSWRTRALRAIGYPKTKQEADHVVPYRVVSRKPSLVRRRASHRKPDHDSERRYSRTEIVSSSSPQPLDESYCVSSDLHKAQTTSGNMIPEACMPTVIELEDEFDLVDEHRLDMDNCSRGVDVRCWGVEPEYSRTLSRPVMSESSRERGLNLDEDIVNELLAKWTTFSVPSSVD